MNHLVPTAVRTASHKNGAANRKKKDPLEFEEFLARWRSGLRAQNVVWEGRRAVAELKRKKMYEFLLCETKSATWQAEDLLCRMVDEMKAYRTEAMSGLAKERFDYVDEFLSREIDRFQAKEDKTTLPSLKALLARLKREIERARKTVGTLKQQKRDWHFGAWRHFWPKKLLRKNLVSRKIELDTQLQVELGKMLADYLRPKERGERVSLETIARLILLAYLAGELAREEKETGMIRTYTTDHILTVRNIRDNLRYANLPKARSFRSGPSPKRQ